MPEPRVDRVRRLMLERGVDERDIDTALSSGRIGLLAMEHLALPAGPRYTPPEVAAAAGLPNEVTAQLWRALGFPSVPDDQSAFTDYDLEALATLSRLIEKGFADMDTAVPFARVIGSSMARIAETEVGIEAGGHTTDADRLAFADALLSSPENFYDLQADLLVYVWRRHLQAAVRRAATVERIDETGALVPLVVGFADLVGYTALSQQISEVALGHLVTRFEETAHNGVTAGGGRVVKMIGDEVMFVVDHLRDGVQIALTLADVFADDDILSDVRVGLASGPVLAKEGDYFGPVVNLASRLVNLAYPGSVVVSADVHDGLADDDELAWKSLRSRHLKGIGSVPLWVVYRKSDEPRSGRRKLRPLRTLLSEKGLERVAET
ncbi:MAG: adenylate/guanylate cyclase domain-containing protein [Acidimicrobiales bacterium]